MIALSLKLFLGLLFLLFLVNPVFAQEYFSEEFNQTRPGGQLDTNKWIVYENRPLGCSGDLIKETGGFVNFIQCTNATRFPYVTSKNDPFPGGNFTTLIKFQYTNVRSWGTGIQLVDTAPANGSGFTSLFSIGVWEDRSSGLNMRINFKDEAVYTTPINISPHELKVERVGSTYKLYFNNQLVFTSPKTSEKVHAIFMGNPVTVSGPPFPGWTWFKVDYIKVVDNGPAEIIPEPFLDLPWDYSDSGKDFKQIAFNPNSWFDHKYPLQNFACCIDQIIDYKGETKDKSYKSHSGYDYGSPQGVDQHTLVRAAAGGNAIFVSEDNSGGAGNMIKIDHGNGYQTWYEHLEEATPGSELVIKEEDAEPVKVEKGDILGRVGLTGNTTGYHIHLSVFKDINNNGDFSDDKPFGLVDPLGWEGNYTDPWEEYSVTDENDVTRNGAKSYKLFTGLTPPKVQQVPISGGSVTDQEFTLNIPGNLLNQPLNFKIENSAFEKASDVIRSIVPSLLLSATNNSGQIITSFKNPLGLLYDYSKADLNNVNEDTIGFYFFNESTNLWERISSVLNKTSKTVSAETTHFSQFAVMAQLLDTTPPSTEAQLSGDKGMDYRYRSDVSVKLIPEDNPGGKGVSYSVYSLDGENWHEYNAPLNFTDEKSHKISFLSHDNAGNTEEIKSVEFSIDKTPPVINAAATAQGNEYTPGTWVNKEVTVSFSCTDSFSGVESVTESKVVSSEGENQKVKGVCSDKAGNRAEFIYKGINIDKTAPVIKISADPDILWPPDNKLVDVKLNGEILEPNLKSNTINIEDEYNLVEPVITDLNQVIKLEAGRKGSDKDGRVYTIKVTAEDLAGNSSAGSIQIVVPHDQKK